MCKIVELRKDTRTESQSYSSKSNRVYQDEQIQIKMHVTCVWSTLTFALQTFFSTLTVPGISEILSPRK